MELPINLFGAVAQEGEIYFFSENCPEGIPNHPHILVRKRDSYLFLNTCSSQLTTSIRLAAIRRWDERTYPVIMKDGTNKLIKDSYVDCNNFVELTAERFGKLLSSGMIRREMDSGVIPEADLARIREGISLSVNISDEDKDRILGE